MKKNSIVVIAGPTASGKTRLGIALAASFGGEIVSADSMQIYRGMDIGTAKAGAAERAAVPHHMLDVADPEENYSVARYVQEAGEICDRLLREGKLPVVVGGTGLYIDSLIAGRDFAGHEEDRTLRRELERQYDELGGEEMLRRLADFDPERARRLHPGDKRRIVRAVEIFRLTGVTATAHDEESRLRPSRYAAARIVLGYEVRRDLYRKIDARVTQMVKNGLFEEVAGLLASGISPACTAMQAIGYKEAALALRGEMTREQAADLIRQGSRRYAKRQLTWFGRWEDCLHILWKEEPDFDAALRISSAFLAERGYTVRA